VATVGGLVVLFGGQADPSTYLNDTWTFDGTTWTQVSIDNPPPVRAYASVATLDGQMIVFGGYANSTMLGDTWTFDGYSWSAVQVTNPPPARTTGAMARLGESVVLFGGQGAPGFLNDTWVFDGADWTQVQTSNTPAPRYDPSMSAAQGQVVLFGGYGGCTDTSTCSSLLNDTWTFDGTNWTAVSGITSPPPARAWASMTAVHSQIVLFGGNGTGGDMNDAWVFDGASWSAINLTGAPARDSASLAFLPN